MIGKGKGSPILIPSLPICHSLTLPEAVDMAQNRLLSCKIFLKFTFPSLWRTLSKNSMKHQTRGQLCFEQKSKIWCRNIHSFLRNCDYMTVCSGADLGLQTVRQEAAC